MTRTKAELNDLQAVLTGSSNRTAQQKRPVDAARVPTVISAADLMGKEFEPVSWVAEDVIPEGLSVLASRPKLGKSWMALDLALAMAMNGIALGNRHVSGGGVLYLALEDTQRRLQDRIRKLLNGEPVPDSLHLTIDVPRMHEGGELWLRQYLESDRAIKLVIVDTLAKFKAPNARGASVYDSEYEAMGAIKRIADDHGISVLVIHHTTKAPTSDDPIDAVSGSTAITGAADTILILSRERGQADATLYVRGRDVEEADFGLSLDPATMQWAIVGTAQEARLSRERQRIVDALRGIGGEDGIQPARPRDIADALGADDKAAAAMRQLLRKMLKEGILFEREGKYTVSMAHTARTLKERVRRGGVGNESHSNHNGHSDHSSHNDHSGTVIDSERLVIAPDEPDHSEKPHSKAENGHAVTAVIGVTDQRLVTPGAVIDHTPNNHKVTQMREVPDALIV